MNITFATPSSTTQSMSSLQISQLVNQRHDNVKRTIDRLVDQSVIALPQIEDVQEVKGNSRTYNTQTYVFSGEQGKLDSITVVAQLCPHFTAMIVKRWQELEHLVSSTEYEKILQQNKDLKLELLKARPQWEDIIRYKDMQLSTTEISKLINRSNSTVTHHIRAMQQLGFEVASNPQPKQLALALDKEV